jgi:hypothetical protein
VYPSVGAGGWFEPPAIPKGTERMLRVAAARTLLMLYAVLGAAGCSEKTGALTPAQERRLESEGVVRRADDLMFRYTHDAGRRDAGWEDRKASIIVTRRSVIIHKNQKLGLEITSSTRRFVQVRRDGDRVRISAGGGGSAESWSFVPPDDAAGWADDIRAVIKPPSAAKAPGKP